MKKILFILAIFSFQMTFAIEHVLEKPNVSDEFVQLNLIEKFVEKSGADYKEVVKSNPEILEGLALNAISNVSAARGGDLPLNIPAIVWGFCCGCIGVAIVYFATDKDNEQSKKAIIGCLISSAIGLVYALVTGSFSTTF
jgi:hypothetical protein